MHVNVSKELAALEVMTAAEWRARYAQVFGEETRIGSKTWLRRQLAVVSRSRETSGFQFSAEEQE
jgi:hypothetical protein